MPIALLWVCLAAGVTGELAPGDATRDLTLGDIRLEVATYKPASYDGGPILIVLHGVLRNASEYRDHAKGMADRYGMLVVAPRFDVERFPAEKYQRGGLLTRDGQVAPSQLWTWSYIPRIAEAIRELEGRPKLPYYIIGHSAGAQFAEKMVAFTEPGAVRIVVANPGTNLFPTREEAYPFGFATLPAGLCDDDHIRRYLSRPLTIYLGTADVERDADLYQGPDVTFEGENRLRRGRNFFRAAEALANERGWPFAWQLVEAPGVGHDHVAMFNHPNCAQALFGSQHPPTNSP